MTTRWTGNGAGGDAYDARWKQMAARGESVHGEADLVSRWVPMPAGAAVLDAGCGTGRVAIELAVRGFVAVGVDADAAMLAVARSKAPEIRWEPADLAELELHMVFDAVVMAGNVLIFVAPGTEATVVARCAAHLRPGGLLIAGFQLGRGYRADQFDEHAAMAGLDLVRRFATWDEVPFGGGDYQVSIHRLRVAS